MGVVPKVRERPIIGRYCVAPGSTVLSRPRRSSDGGPLTTRSSSEIREGVRSTLSATSAWLHPFASRARRSAIPSLVVHRTGNSILPVCSCRLPPSPAHFAEKAAMILMERVSCIPSMNYMAPGAMALPNLSTASGCAGAEVRSCGNSTPGRAIRSISGAVTLRVLSVHQLVWHELVAVRPSASQAEGRGFDPRLRAPDNEIRQH